MPTPLVPDSDGPGLPTGLARITRDLAGRLWEGREMLGIDLLQVGYDPRPRGRGVEWPSYRLTGLGSDGDWGAAEIQECWREYFGHDDGGLLSIWDPARAFALLGLQSDTRAFWGYFPVDPHNVQGSFGGPAREAVQCYDRVLAYGRWGSQVLATIRRPVQYLPHGLDLDVWRLGHAPDVAAEAERVLRAKPGSWVLGCVATNQPRKDLGLYFATLAELRRRGERVRGWLHTDSLVRAWSVWQLADDFDLKKHVAVSLDLPDAVLAACYRACGATFAPGLGEGFGYPQVESLACGTPVVSVDYAGGRELNPLNAWRVPACAWRVEGCYGLRRAVVGPVDPAHAVMRAGGWPMAEDRVGQAVCPDAIAYLDWNVPLPLA